MADLSLTHEQAQVIQAPLSSHLFLDGPAGTGKTTAGVARLLHLIEEGVPANQILVLVPQRTLGEPYHAALRRPDLPAGGQTSVLTVGGLAQRMIALFWPAIYRIAGFGKKSQPPAFLNLETAQYYLAILVKPLLDSGFFQSVKIDRNRLLSQILDNLNKAAVIGIPHTKVAELLKASWIGEPAQQHVYEEAQQCADQFRQFCLENNLLDFSLQVETFAHHLWTSFLCREYLAGTYRHLIYDNVEEDVPVVHDIIQQWLPAFDSALLIYDTDGGYRSFLGADPQSGKTLQAGCEDSISLSSLFVVPPALESFRVSLEERIQRIGTVEVDPAIRSVVAYQANRYLPEMIQTVTSQVSELIESQGVPPGEIAIMAPFLSDSLRFSLMGALERAGIPVRSHRPSRSLREEPATLCLLTLARLAHADWCLNCSHYDVRTTFMGAIAGLDLVRADLLAKIVFRPKRLAEGLGSFDKILPQQQERITFRFGELYERLRRWILEYQKEPVAELDIFLSRIFGEILSQPGFGFHDNLDAASVAARLIESAQRFRRATSRTHMESGLISGKEYIRMVDEGVVGTQYLEPQFEPTPDAVFIAPAFTFLMINRPVDYQFWLDLGSQGWWERLYQPLTHPYVLTRRWPEGRVWTDADEVAADQATLSRLVNGLIRRCRKGIFLCTNRMNEQGDEQRGPLLLSVQSIFRRIPLSPEVENV